MTKRTATETWEPSLSDMSDLRRAHRYTVGSTVGRYVTLALLVGWVGLIAYGYAADIGPGTNPSMNGYIGLSFFVMVTTFAIIGVQVIRRDRRFRKAEPELYRLTSIWISAPSTRLRQELRRASLKRWLTGRTPWWMANDIGLRDD